MKVLDQIRALPGAIESLTLALTELIAVHGASAPAAARLEELERSRAKWEAEMEALVLKADSTLRSSNNAESRARTMLRHYENESDPFDDGGEEIQTTVFDRDAIASEAEGMLPLRMDVETNSKTRALRAKFGG